MRDTILRMVNFTARWNFDQPIALIESTEVRHRCRSRRTNERSKRLISIGDVTFSNELWKQKLSSVLVKVNERDWQLKVNFLLIMKKDCDRYYVNYFELKFDTIVREQRHCLDRPVSRQQSGEDSELSVATPNWDRWECSL